MTAHEFLSRIRGIRDDARIVIGIDGFIDGIHDSEIENVMYRLSDNTITIVISNTHLPTFDDGYDAGYLDAVKKMMTAMYEIADGEE